MLLTYRSQAGNVQLFFKIAYSSIEKQKRLIGELTHAYVEALHFMAIEPKLRACTVSFVLFTRCTSTHVIKSCPQVQLSHVEGEQQWENQSRISTVLKRNLFGNPNDKEGSGDANVEPMRYPTRKWE